MNSNPTSRRVTIRDVAALAGVSQPTASLVLSRNPRARVAPATRDRVLRAVSTLGYRPNVIARALVARRSYALAVLVPDLRNPFFAEVVSGAERVAVEEGYAVLLCETREIAAERHLDALRTRQVDGVIIDAIGAGALSDETLAGLNVVLVDEPADRRPGVATDALAAGRVAAGHLLGLGHRRLAFLGPALEAHAFRLRERGFVQALRAAGVGLPSDWLVRTPATVAGGVAAMRRLLSAKQRPSAVFCANDLVALGAVKACAAAGVRVPGEISLMGCDDIEMARVVTPELTTVTIPARELGARAARLLLRRLAGEPINGLGKLLPVRLAARGTTGPAAADPTA